MNLDTKGWLALATLALITSALLFAAAGAVRYWQGWVYLILTTTAFVAITLDLMRRDPALLQRRMSGGPFAEQRPAQRAIMAGASLCYIALLVVPALDHRFRGSAVPAPGVLIADGLIVIGLFLVSRVYRQNTYLSARIEVARDQVVVSTGGYAIVRHPMYASATLYILATPLALGSYWGLVPALAMVPFLIARLLDEERLLTESLPGYSDYRKKVRYRLVPFVW